VPYGTPSNPVGGTVITVSYATVNILDPIRWLRLMTGNADPPGTAYVVVSTGPAGATWQKVTSDVLAAGAVVAHLGYTPANRAGDSFSGAIDAPSVVVTSPGANALVVSGGASFGSNVAASGGYGAMTGSSLAVSGAITTSSTGGNSIQTPGGISATGNIASANGLVGASLTIAGVTASATAAAGRIPIANASGKLDTWITGGGAGTPIPSGLGGWVRSAAEIPAGFARETALDGLMPIGAGTSFSQTFTEATSYGSAWLHNHSVPAASVSVTGSATGGPADNTGASTAINGLAAAGGVNLNTTGHTHPLNGVSLAVSASGNTTAGTAGNTTWLPPMRAVVWVRKT
jgi:hypothetical protein